LWPPAACLEDRDVRAGALTVGGARAEEASREIRRAERHQSAAMSTTPQIIADAWRIGGVD